VKHGQIAVLSVVCNSRCVPVQAAAANGAHPNCPVVTADGLPEDPPEPSVKKADTPPEEESFEAGCILTMEVVGDVPAALPRGRALKSLLGGGSAGGLAFVEFNPVRSHLLCGALPITAVQGAVSESHGQHARALVACARSRRSRTS
jgi:hypothetical protein